MAMIDTIAAPGTATGLAALSVIRVSGPEAFRILARLCPDLNGTVPARRAVLATIVDPGTGATLDQGVVVRYEEPASYTGEDLVEISCHGGFLAPALVLEACLDAGARMAEPGEFTRRAYLSGKMDLIQAEAVLDLVEGRNRALHSRAVHQLERGLSNRISELREGVVGLEALLVHHIDFPEEDEPPVPMGGIISAGREIMGSMASLLVTAPEGELLREGALTVLAGRPNSGKSSLFNALVGWERAIVTEIPGTTRDALEAVVSIGGFPFRLVDTAGIRESEGQVEQLGIEVARRYLIKADLILFCADAGTPLSAEEEDFLQSLDARPVIHVRTKADRVPEQGAGAGEDAAPWMATVSVETGEGLEQLRALLPEIVFGGLVNIDSDVPVLTRARQTRGVRRARQEVEAFVNALEQDVPPELAATHLLSAKTALEELLGVILPEEVLDRVFREFCIGK
jgi:tRNA modification GTPase